MTGTALMKWTHLSKRLILFSAILCGSPLRGDELKGYYEQQVELFKAAFQAPLPGTEVKLDLAGGQSRTGILMKLSPMQISLMTDSGMVSYKRQALQESARARFFAEDYAQAMALEKTREFKQQLLQDNQQEKLAGTHAGRISVVASADKSSDKSVEEQERETRAGDLVTTTKTTRTYTLIQNLKITISNSMSHPDDYTLEWYFYAMPVGSSNVRMHDKGSRNVRVEGMKRVVELVASDPYVSEKVTTNRSAGGDGSETESGVDDAGWLVVLKHAEKILDTKASSRSYLSKEWLDDL